MHTLVLFGSENIGERDVEGLAVVDVQLCLTHDMANNLSSLLFVSMYTLSLFRMMTNP